MIKAIH